MKTMAVSAEYWPPNLTRSSKKRKTSPKPKKRVNENPIFEVDETAGQPGYKGDRYSIHRADGKGVQRRRPDIFKLLPVFPVPEHCGHRRKGK